MSDMNNVILRNFVELANAYGLFYYLDEIDNFLLVDKKQIQQENGYYNNYRIEVDIEYGKIITYYNETGFLKRKLTVDLCDPLSIKKTSDLLKSLFERILS